MPFVKLDTGILDSSLWSEPSSTRICWITLLAMADCTGLVKSTAPGIAKRANLGTAETTKALEIFESPDEHSRSLNDQGKKIRRVDGGYQIINYQKYRDYDYTAAERMRRFRALRRNGRNKPNKTVTLRKQKQSTEAYKKPPSPLFKGEVPESLLSEKGFETEWSAFCDMRKAKRAALTPRAAELILERLSERPKDAIPALQIAIIQNWTGFKWEWFDKGKWRLPYCQSERKKPAPVGDAYRPIPPAREPTQEELEAAAEIAKRETEKLRQSLRH